MFKRIPLRRVGARAVRSDRAFQECGEDGLYDAFDVLAIHFFAPELLYRIKFDSRVDRKIHHLPFR